MANLHFLFQPHQLHKLIVNNGDALVLLNNASLLARQNLSGVATQVYVRQADLEARGISSSVHASVTPLDDHAWVNLCLKFDKVISWP